MEDVLKIFSGERRIEMPQVNITTARIVPNFARFLEVERESLGLYKQSYATDGSQTDFRVIDPDDAAEKLTDKKVIGSFRVIPVKGGSTIVQIAVEEPPSEMPSWLSKLLADYQTLVFKWTSEETVNVEVEYVYG